MKKLNSKKILKRSIADDAENLKRIHEKENRGGLDSSELKQKILKLHLKGEISFYNSRNSKRSSKCHINDLNEFYNETIKNQVLSMIKVLSVGD